MSSPEPPSYDEVVRGNARPACLQDDEGDGMPLLFRDGPLEIAVESIEAAPAWCVARQRRSRRFAACDLHANSRQLCQAAAL